MLESVGAYKVKFEAALIIFTIQPKTVQFEGRRKEKKKREKKKTERKEKRKERKKKRKKERKERRRVREKKNK